MKKKHIYVRQLKHPPWAVLVTNLLSWGVSRGVDKLFFSSELRCNRTGAFDIGHLVFWYFGVYFGHLGISHCCRETSMVVLIGFEFFIHFEHLKLFLTLFFLVVFLAVLC